MPSYPKFEQKIQDKIVKPAQAQASAPNYGLIMEYDTYTNTAKILMSAPGSETFGEIYTNVPCPTAIGVQTVAPEPGRMCWVTFKDNAHNFPVITNYFNTAYSQVDWARQNSIEHNTPRFMYM